MPQMTPRSRVGRVQRQVARAFIAQPGATFHTGELARQWVYPRSSRIVRWQRQAIRRAADQVALRVGRDRQGVIWGEIRRLVATMLPKPPES